MRPLNRPMFRYGGPIKEGIMTGMKEKQAINTVGSPLAPKDETGRGGYAIPLIAGVGMGLARLAPFALRGARAVQGLFGRRKFVPDIGTKIARTGGGPQFTPVKSIFEPNKLGSYLMASPEYRFATGAGGAASKFVKGAAKGLAKSPLGIGVTAATLTDIFPGGKPFGPDKLLPNILGQRFDEEGNKIPGTGFFNPDKVTEGENQGLQRSTAEELDGTSTAGIDPTKLKKLNEDRIERTKKRYYELMGLDKMKEGAVYDSLIDASKVVSEEGADLKGAIKSGSLQNKIIQAIGKNLDKSAALKQQIDAAILKGEIQKDIASADSIDRDLKQAKLKAYERAEKQSGAAGVISDTMNKQEGVITGAQTAAILRADGIKYDSVIQDKLFTDFQKDNPTKDEVDFVISKGSAFPDGRFVIGGRLVQKKGNKVAFIV